MSLKVEGQHQKKKECQIQTSWNFREVWLLFKAWNFIEHENKKKTGREVQEMHSCHKKDARGGQRSLFREQY